MLKNAGESICVYRVFGGYFVFFIEKWVETDNMFGPIMLYVLFYIFLYIF